MKHNLFLTGKITLFTKAYVLNDITGDMSKLKFMFNSNNYMNAIKDK